jgi:hypothetical protein
MLEFMHIFKQCLTFQYVDIHIIIKQSNIVPCSSKPSVPRAPVVTSGDWNVSSIGLERANSNACYCASSHYIPIHFSSLTKFK